jgi:TolB-like protein/Flp pilus assembly protein TadD
MSFLGEIRRRNVFRVAVAYAAIAWLAIQVASIVYPAFELQPWAMQLTLVMAAVGFVVAVILAWLYELTPEGIKRAADVPESAGTARMSGRKLDFVIIGVLAVGLAFVVVDRYLFDRPTALDDDARSVAVLPFVNQSAAQENAEFFAVGIHEAILTQLAKIGDIKVISRTSVMEYEGTTKSVREIGEELGVATVLQGSVLRAGNAVRINVQLIDAASDQHLWAELYDQELTAENLFAIQTEMATSIADTLQAALHPEEIARLNDVLTENTRAYDFYLSGNTYFNRPDDRMFKPLAIQQYERAVDEDSTFSEAWAAMSRAHVTLYWFADPTPARLGLAEQAAQRAQDLAPDSPDTHIALGLLYDLGHRVYDRALAEYASAEALVPDDPYVNELAAYTHRRMGDFQSAADRFEQLIDRDPRNLDLLEQQANTLAHLRDFDGAERYIERALELAPDFDGAYVLRAWNAWRRDGDVRVLRDVVENPAIDVGSRADYFLWIAALYERDYAAALESLESWDGDVFSEQYLYSPKALFAGMTYRLAGEEESARTAFQEARLVVEQALSDNPEDPRFHVALGQVLAGLGDIEAAEREARRAMEIMPRSKDDWSGGWIQFQAIIGVFAPAGNVEAVVEELDIYLSHASGWSIEGLLPDPRLDRVRDDPLFQELVMRYARP